MTYQVDVYQKCEYMLSLVVNARFFFSTITSMPHV